MKRAWNQVVGLTLAVLCLAVAAAAATVHSTVAVKVIPAGPLHPKERFSITLSASFQKSQLKGKYAFLLSFIQYTDKPCESDVNKELNRTLPTQGSYYHHEFSTSPFTTSRNFTAGAAGHRRVCAYLFGRRVKPGTTERPIAHTHATYDVIK